MDSTTVTELIPVLQTAIGPVILISGVGLILLTMTNRLGRIVDRSRTMATELPKIQGNDHDRIEEELNILWRRANLMRFSIGGVTLSALSSAILVIVLFVSAWLHFDSGTLVGILFIIAMGSLCAALFVFIYEIHLSLKAIEIEVRAVRPTLNKKC